METQVAYGYNKLMWWDFKHDLENSFKLCGLKKWENIRDKRLTKDE